MDPKITVIICTLNRAHQLRRALASLTAQSLAPELYEIVVVDNGSTDDTRDVVDQCRAGCPVPLVYVHEARRGVSPARNCGIKTARGDILAFMDDDAHAAPTWLSSLAEILDRQNGADAAGGPILAASWLDLPAWLPKRLVSYLSVLNYGDKERRLAYPRFPFGTNMAFKRRVFARVGEFNAELGRMGNCSFTTGEETELFLRIARAGGDIVYTPKAVVHHAIHPENLSPRWFYRQAFYIGASFAVMHLENRLISSILPRTLCALLLLGLGIGGGLAAIAFPQRRLTVYYGCVLMDNLGYLCRLMGSLAGRTSLRR